MAAERTVNVSWNLRLIFFLSIFARGNTLFFLDQVKAVINPPDAFVIIGETLRVTCTLTSTFSGNVSQVRFKITANENSWFLPTENQTDLGGSVVQTYVHITKKFVSVTSLGCFHEGKQLRSTKIYTEKPLISITNITEIFYNSRLSYVHFAWSSNKKYYMDPDAMIETNTFYSYNGIPENWITNGTACDDVQSEMCDAKTYNGGYYIDIRFHVSYKTSKKRPGLDYLLPLYETEVSIDHHFVLEDIHKIETVTDIRLKDVGKTCINITWTLPWTPALNKDELLYRIELTEERREKLLNKEGIQRPQSSTEMVQVCDLMPFTHYSLTVRVKKEDINPWSDPSFQVSVTTKEDRPLIGPSVMLTGYHEERSCENGQRQILVYWNPISEPMIRGRLIGYTVQVLNDTMKTRPSSNFYRTKLPCFTGSEVKLSALTELGPSLKPSVLKVPAINSTQDFSQISDIMFMVKEVLNEKRDEKTISVTWNSDIFNKNGSQVSLTIYMCEEAEPSTCFNDYETVQVEAIKGKILLMNISQFQNLFGYSLNNSRGQKTGIKWTDCVYQDGLAPPKPTDLQAHPDPEAGVVRVMWSDMRCNRRKKIFVTSYDLSICPRDAHVGDDHIQAQKSCKSVTIPSHEGSSHVFRNLEGGRSYRVRLQAKSEGGSSQFATSIVTPSSGSTNNPPLVGTVMIVLAIAISLGFLFFFICRCYKKYKRADEVTNQVTKLMEEPEKLTTPHKESDSGVYSAVGTQKPSLCPHPISPQKIDEDALILPAEKVTRRKKSVQQSDKSKLSMSDPSTTQSQSAREQQNEDVLSYSKQVPQQSHVGDQKTGNAFSQKVYFRNVTKSSAFIDEGFSSPEEKGSQSAQGLSQRGKMFDHLKNIEVQAVSIEPQRCKIKDIDSKNTIPSGSEYIQQGLQKGSCFATRKTPVMDPAHLSNKVADGYTDDPLKPDIDDVSHDESWESHLFNDDRSESSDKSCAQSECDNGYKEESFGVTFCTRYLENDGYKDNNKEVYHEPIIQIDGYSDSKPVKENNGSLEESSVCSEREEEDLLYSNTSSLERPNVLSDTVSGYQSQSFLEASNIPSYKI